MAERPTTTRPVVPHPSVDERRAHGRAVRKELPRRELGTFSPAPDRDPIGILTDQETRRVPDLVPLRRERMSVSPFAFFRGAAAIFAADLAAGTAQRPAGAALRRRPPGQLRWLRLTRAHARLRHQRLRRDPARPLRVGRQATGRQLRGRRPLQRPRHRRPRGRAADPRPHLRPGHGPLRRDGPPRPLVPPAQRRGDHRRPRARRSPPTCSRGSSATWPRPGTRTA